jgi:hypothetical protein
MASQVICSCIKHGGPPHPGRCLIVKKAILEHMKIIGSHALLLLTRSLKHLITRLSELPSHLQTVYTFLYCVWTSMYLLWLSRILLFMSVGPLNTHLGCMDLKLSKKGCMDLNAVLLVIKARMHLSASPFSFFFFWESLKFKDHKAMNIETISWSQLS